MPGLPDRPARPAGQCWPVAPVVLDLLIYLGLTRIVRRHNTAVTYLSLVACAAITFLVSAQPIIEGHIERSGKPMDVIPDSNHPPLSKEKLAQARLESRKQKYGADKKQDVSVKRLSYCMAPKAQFGKYSSFDGGKSALRLVIDCPDESTEYTNNCMNVGRQKDECAWELAIFAQITIKMFGK